MRHVRLETARRSLDETHAPLATHHPSARMGLGQRERTENRHAHTRDEIVPGTITGSIKQGGGIVLHGSKVGNGRARCPASPASDHDPLFTFSGILAF